MADNYKHSEFGANNSDNQTILSIQYDEKRLNSLNKVMSELTSFVNKSQHGLLRDQK